MHRRPLITLAAGAVLFLAACSSGAATSAPTAQATAAPTVEASAAPTVKPTAAPTVEATAAPTVEASISAACAESATAGEVSVAIKDFVFNPADIQAKIGQTVTFTNGDSAPHSATLDDKSCTTPTILKGAADGLVFNAAGIYPFHCKVHPVMTGTITIS